MCLPSLPSTSDPANPDGGADCEEEDVLSPGTVIGFAESLLPDKTLAHSYTAASFVHLLYFDRAAMVAEAERRPQLLRSLWWLIAAQVKKEGGSDRPTARTRRLTPTSPPIPLPNQYQ